MFPFYTRTPQLHNHNADMAMWEVGGLGRRQPHVQEAVCHLLEAAAAHHLRRREGDAGPLRRAQTRLWLSRSCICKGWELNARSKECLVSKGKSKSKMHGRRCGKKR